MKTLFSGVVVAALFISGCGSGKGPKYSADFIESENDKIIGDRFGNLRFGLPKKDAEIEIDKYNSQHTIDSVKFIRNFKYESITCDYDNDRLYKICVHGTKNSKSADTAILYNFIKEVYQEPDDSAIHNFVIRKKDGKDVYYYSNLKTWEVGEKNIIIQEEVRDSVKTVNLLVYQRYEERNVAQNKIAEKKYRDSIMQARERSTY